MKNFLLDRLTTASAVSGLANYNETYSYNATTGNLASKAGVNYTYDAIHKHAVASLSNGNTYSYDANGNMLTRHIATGSLAGDYTLSYDAENRLIGVTKNGSSIATFVYDGDGKQVQATVNGIETIYAGTHYEKQGNSIAKYYFAGSQRIALRKDGVLNFLVSDHLGSTTITTNANGVTIASMLYKAWGETRYGSLTTKYEFTGQRNEEGIGLHFYNARWYDSSLGRFASPDSVIPELSQGVQAWDRLAYGNNNPVRYNDPTGHCINCIVLVTLIATALILVDYGADGHIDVLPSAGISLVSTSESLALTNDHYMKPFLIEIDIVETSNETEPFITVAQRTPTGCNGPCAAPYPHFMSPNASIALGDGKIWGDAIKQDIFNFEGRAYNVNIGAGLVTITAFTSVNNSTGKADFKIFGADISIGPSLAGISVSAYYSETKALKKALME